ncbi:hypothetical protein NPIL_450621 [Nephila pilipes]|uniref:Uncharacterized protein n=1 Tax=Nephila pilipes TaxID=299642 RepID=A0A8X6NFM7_NEPPI|nr:hypothetical protein NPIL_450621 [Nephila pilipes]
MGKVEMKLEMTAEQEELRKRIDAGQEEIRSILQTKVEEIEIKMGKVKELSDRFQDVEKYLEFLETRPYKDGRLQDFEKRLEFLETCPSNVTPCSERFASHSMTSYPPMMDRLSELYSRHNSMSSFKLIAWITEQE